MKRDSQKRKLYAAERVALDAIAKRLDAQGVDELASRVLKSQRVMNKWPLANPKRGWRFHVKHAGNRHCAATGSNTQLYIPNWAQKDWVILHEMAHVIIGRSEPFGAPAHGWRFAECYLYLVKAFMGIEAAAALKQAFKAHRVRFTQPRKKKYLTPAETIALRERMAAMRAAQKAKAPE